MKTEPVMMAGGIASAILLVVTSFIAMMVGLGVWSLSDVQLDLVTGFVSAVIGLGVIAAPVLLSLWARTKVRPIAKMSDDELVAMDVALAKER